MRRGRVRRGRCGAAAVDGEVVGRVAREDFPSRAAAAFVYYHFVEAEDVVPSPITMLLSLCEMNK